MENKLIPANVVEALYNYLRKRPWDEVAEVMPILANLPTAPVIPAAETKE